MRCGDGMGEVTSHSVNCRCDEIEKEIELTEAVAKIPEKEQKEILKKAIEKAVEDGWNASLLLSWDPFSLAKDTEWFNRLVVSTIFSHDFAKSFWGEGMTTPDILKLACEGNNLGKSYKETVLPYMGWKYHIGEMAREEEPLKYIERYL